MKFLYKLERKFGRYAIENLSKYIVICFSISYVLSFLFPDVYAMLVFSPYHIIVNHQIWRIFTWIFTVPNSFGFFTLIMLFFYYSIGNSIERAVGSFMYNLYIFSGLIITTIGTLIVSFIRYFQLDLNNTSSSISINDIAGGDSVMITNAVDSFMVEGIIGGAYMTHYLLIGIFLGFALIHSDSIVLLYFLIPFKVKWLAYIDVIIMGVDFATTSNPYRRVIIISYLLVFLIMTMLLRNYNPSRRMYSTKIRRIKTVKRDSDEQVRGQVINMPTGSNTITRHKCAICGRTEKDGDELEFRFCSKCNGNYEYCNEHLYTHEHIK